jgi:hypothetical protein
VASTQRLRVTVFCWIRTDSYSTKKNNVRMSAVIASRKVDVKLHGKGICNSHGARPVHLIITMMMWTRTSRSSIKNCYSAAIGLETHREQTIDVMIVSGLQILN